MPIAEVMSRQYLLLLTGFALLTVGGFLLDRMVASARWATTTLAGHDLVESFLRAAMAAFFVALFASGAVSS